jgi:BirA family transcriptional regulator, biotin operon repressor / biotin---[acetyl-CoA-carboxylase] ligase
LTIWPPGVGLASLGEIDSTNAEAHRRAQAGEAGPLWITAKRQSAGRGRRGRAWETGQGNLAATLLLRIQVRAEQVAQLSFAAALAVADLAAYFAPQSVITVKWPNDVLANGRKLSGILLEAGIDWLAIGVGINLASFPSGTEFPATSLAAQGVAAPTPDAALTVLADRFALWLARWQAEGFEPLRSAWLAQAGGLGLPIRARLPHEERHGAFEGIDASGALLLRDAAGVCAITAGEVFF